MKNQNDLFVIIGCSLVAIIATVVMFFMKREPVAPPAPQAVLVTNPVYPDGGKPSMAASLSGGSNSSAGGFGGMMGGMGGMMGGRGPGGPGGMGGPGGPPNMPMMGGVSGMGAGPGAPGSGSKRGLARG